MSLTKTFKQIITRMIPGTYSTETIELQHSWKGADPLSNDHRVANYHHQTGRSELTPRQARRVRHHANRKGN